MTATVTIWLLLTQGSGPSSSQIVETWRYESQAACEADGKKIQHAFYSDYLCLEVQDHQKR